LLLVSILMVSKVEYYVMPKASFRHSKKNSFEIIAFLVCVITVTLFPHETFYPLILLYILWGLFLFILKLIRFGNAENPRKGIEKA